MARLLLQAWVIFCSTNTELLIPGTSTWVFNPALLGRFILLAREQGYGCLDLGRASGTDEVSLGIFKEHLGAEKKPLLYYSTLKAYSETGKSGGASLAGKVLRLAPGWVAGLAGRMFYRYLG